jgi:hypothetical protein
MSWEDSRPDLLFLLQRVTEPYSGFQAAFDVFQTLSFPIRYFIAKDDTVATEPLVPHLKSRETDQIDDDVRSTLPTELELLSEPLQELMNEVVTSFYDRGGQYMGVNRASLTRFGYYDDWNEVLARKSNDTYVRVCVCGARCRRGQQLTLRFLFLGGVSGTLCRRGTAGTALQRTSILSHASPMSPSLSRWG